MAGGRKSKTAQPARPATTLVVDNGAHSIKAGLVRADLVEQPLVIPNCLARDRSSARRVHVGSGLSQCRDFGEVQFRRPVERGFVVNWEVQREVWDHEFLRDGAPLRCDPAETRLVLAEQPNALPALQAHCDQIVFEEYGFTSYYRGIGPAMNAYHDTQAFFCMPQPTATAANVPAEIALVIDSGYSHTTVTPLLTGRPLHSAVRRLDVGGKLLTNYLTRLLSVRHYDMRNDTYIVNEMKEAACYVSADFRAELDAAWKGTKGDTKPGWATGSGGIAKDYVLPDFHARAKGILRDYDPAMHTKARKLAAADSVDEDIITLRNERFAVPELLFNPSDIGLRQPGLADLVRQSLDALPVGLWPGLLANVVVVGGNALLDGFVPRLQKELLQRFPDDCVVRVARPVDPVASTWFGAAHLANHPSVEAMVVTKQEYDEYGGAWVAKRFADGAG